MALEIREHKISHGELFDHLQNVHKLALHQSELDKIIEIARAIPVEGVQTVYVARDGDGQIFQTSASPEWSEESKDFNAPLESYQFPLLELDFPEIQPGECFSAKILLGEKL